MTSSRSSFQGRTWSMGHGSKGTLKSGSEPGKTPSCGNQTRSMPHTKRGMTSTRPSARARPHAARSCASCGFISAKCASMDDDALARSAGSIVGSYASRPPGGS